MVTLTRPHASDHITTPLVRANRIILRVGLAWINAPDSRPDENQTKLLISIELAGAGPGQSRQDPRATMLDRLAENQSLRCIHALASSDQGFNGASPAFREVDISEIAFRDAIMTLGGADRLVPGPTQMRYSGFCFQMTRAVRMLLYNDSHIFTDHISSTLAVLEPGNGVEAARGE
ncbi:MAG: hypothetical protein Q9159_004340 [Coniocarpon cinnabarinum]